MSLSNNRAEHREGGGEGRRGVLGGVSCQLSFLNSPCDIRNDSLLYHSFCSLIILGAAHQAIVEFAVRLCLSTTVFFPLPHLSADYNWKCEFFQVVFVLLYLATVLNGFYKYCQKCQQVLGLITKCKL